MRCAFSLGKKVLVQQLTVKARQLSVPSKPLQSHGPWRARKKRFVGAGSQSVNRPCEKVLTKGPRQVVQCVKSGDVSIETLTHGSALKLTSTNGGFRKICSLTASTSGTGVIAMATLIVGELSRPSYTRQRKPSTPKKLVLGR